MDVRCAQDMRGARFDSPWGPLPSRKIHLLSASGWKASACTDTAGRAKFNSVPPGRLTVWCDTVTTLDHHERIVDGREIAVAGGARHPDTLKVVCGFSLYR